MICLPVYFDTCNLRTNVFVSHVTLIIANISGTKKSGVVIFYGAD